MTPVSNDVLAGGVPGAAVAVIGAGLAGAACARGLQAAGVQVTVFDKSRGVGGRLATRRALVNLPGQAEGHWEWRFEWSQLRDGHTAELATLSSLYGR